MGFVAGTYRFLRCQQCQSALLDPKPDAQEIASFYPPHYLFTLTLCSRYSWKYLLGFLEELFFFRPLTHFQVRKVLRKIDCSADSRRMLDLGCGSGRHLKEFKKQGWEALGMDIQNYGVTSIIKGDISQIGKSYSANTFELVTAFHVLEHLSDVRELLISSFEILKPGGWMAAAIPLSDGWMAEKLKEKWSGVTEAPRHLSIPSRHGIEWIFKQSGFKNTSFQSDTILFSAATYAISYVERAANFYIYGNRKIHPILLRILGGVLLLAFLPIAWVESYWLKRPSIAIVCGQKPH